MGAQEYDEILDKLVKVAATQAEQQAAYNERMDHREKEVEEMFHFAKDVADHSTIEIKHMSNAIESIKKDRAATLKRCDILMEQNTMLLKRLDKKDDDMRELRARYDRLVGIVETALMAHGTSGGNSAANVIFNGLKSIQNDD